MNERTIFFEALDLPPNDRAAFLDEACANNPSLKRRIETLLQKHDTDIDFLRLPVVEQLGIQISDFQTKNEGSLDFLETPHRAGSLGRLGHYEVLEEIGRGGMGLVLRAFDEKLHRVVALKLLAPSNANSPSARQRFAREARAAAAVNHENVINIFAVEDSAAIPYLVMEFVEGKTLQEKIHQKTPNSLQEILRIGFQMAEGLAAAHRQGLVHRDIKPTNILLENGVERVKITDFGLARGVDDASVTQVGLIAGTPQYMSPEQARGERVDARSDLFSLGTVLYALCTGQEPFRADSSLATLRQVCDLKPRSICEVNPTLPRALGVVIERLMAKRPQDRFGSAAEVAEVLSKLMSGQYHGEPIPMRRRWLGAAAGLVACVALAVVFGLPREPVPAHDSNPTPSSVPEKPAADIPIAKTPPTDEEVEWQKTVAAMPVDQQFKAVVGRLRECNPRFDMQAKRIVRDGELVGLKFPAHSIDDLRPLQALKKLEVLDCGGAANDRGRIADLSPLRGLPLKYLIISDNVVSDLSPLEGMPLISLCLARNVTLKNLKPLSGLPLKYLDLNHTSVSDLSPLARAKHLQVLHLDQTLTSDLTPLRELPLTTLSVPFTKVADLSPLRGMGLNSLSLLDTPVTDLSPIRGMPLEDLNLTLRPEHDRALLRSLSGLKLFNSKSPTEFWREVDGE